MPLSLSPETVIEERPSWNSAVNRNQDLLGKTMLVLQRPCESVIDIEVYEWIRLRLRALGASSRRSRVSSIRTSSTSPS